MTEMRRDAIIDPTGRYRYFLLRSWGPGKILVWVMLNPSKADALDDDPTLGRCIQFARDMGFGGLWIVNMYGLRSKDPKVLLRDTDPVGPDNDDFLALAARNGDMVICAWGADKAVKRRRGQVLKILRDLGVKPMCLKLTKGGEPWHPLYLRSDLRPFPLPEAA